MVLLADTDILRTPGEVAAFVAGHAAADIAKPPRAAASAHSGTVLARLDREAHARTDNEAARELNAAWDRLLRELRAEGA